MLSLWHSLLQQSSHCFHIHANSWHHCFIRVGMEQSPGFAVSHDIGFILTVNEVHNVNYDFLVVMARE